MNSGELRYAAEDPDAKVYRMVAAGHEIHEYSFDGPPHLGFPASFDVRDLTWQLDGIERRVERLWLLRKLADSDPEQVRQNLLRVIALADLMQVVPAHDSGAYAGIPDLPARPTPAPTVEAPGRN